MRRRDLDCAGASRRPGSKRTPKFRRELQADEKSALGESLSIAGTRPGGPADDRPEGPRQRHDNVLAYDGRVRAAACCLCRQQRQFQLRGAADATGNKLSLIPISEPTRLGMIS